MESLSTAFGRAVRKLREDAGVSQERFAYKAGIDRAFMSRIERGKTNASLTTIDRVAKALNVSLETLFEAVERERSRRSPAK